MPLSDPGQNILAAVRHHEAGRFAEAEAIYREMLAHDSGHVDALHLLGVVAGQTGREEEAIILIGRAIALRPDIPAQHNNLGNILRQLGKLPQAIDSFRTAVGLDPSYARAWNNLGNALMDSGPTAAAIKAYQRSIELAPGVPEVHSNLGIALREQGRLEEAIGQHRQAVALGPTSSEAFNNLGVALRDAGRMREALEAHARALVLRPDSLSALCNLAAAQRREGETDQAIQTLGKALALNPRYPDAHNNLGSALIDQGDFASAEQSCRVAISLRRGFADAHGNLAIALAYQGRVEEAMDNARLAVRFMPNQPLAHWNLSMLLLLVGDFDLGWREHEWRWKCPSMLKGRQFTQPRWDGEELNGQTILLFAEQGFGDTIQFIRFAPLVAQCGGRVIVECQPELLQLFHGMPSVSALVRAGDPLPPFEWQCPLMSVPFALRNRGAMPLSVPYLPGARKPISDTERRLNVGLVWAGDPAHQNDRNRSMALRQLAPLASNPGITFHGLQKGPAAAELAALPAGFQIIDHASQLTSFAATALILESLDLVIAVDTAVAHLAAAMGKSAWILLPFMPDWRWMLHRSDCLWYPTVRLFRQTKANEWEPVVAQVAEAMEVLLRKRL
jgi:tetratricopeptide (TPR) repeat protein